MGQMSKKHKKFKLRKSKYVTNLRMWSSWWGFPEGYPEYRVSLLVSILSILLPKYRYYIDTYFLRYFPLLKQNNRLLIAHRYFICRVCSRYSEWEMNRSPGLPDVAHFRHIVRSIKSTVFVLAQSLIATPIPYMFFRKNEPAERT